MTNSRRTSPGLSFLRQTGFTVMELLMGIAVLAILTTLAVPAFTQLLQNNRLDAQANEMVASFQFARSEALKRGVRVQVCPSANGTSCGGGWNDGRIAVANPGDDQEVLRVWASPGENFTVTPAGGTIGFQPSGFATGSAQFDLSMDGTTDNNNRRVSIENSGRVVSCRIDECGDDS